MKRRSLTVRAAALAVLALAVATSPGVVAQADPPAEVDQALLVPTTLDSAFAPFTCRSTPTGPVCTGEWHLDTGWQPVDFPCDVPIHNRFVANRFQVRYYDHDFLNYDRHFRSRDIDYFSPDPDGPATGTIRTNVRFVEPFAVPGDDATRTIITSGTLYDIRGVRGPALFRMVGTLAEPPGEVGRFSGHVTRDGVTTTYGDAPIDVVLPEEDFLDYVCRATIGG
jgi:hypothetical protein